MEHQLTAARDLGDSAAEAKASSDLGAVYQKMGDFDAAIGRHERDLAISSERSQQEDDAARLADVARALCNLGSVNEAAGRLDEAAKFYERHLGIANQVDDPGAKTQAYENLGRMQHRRGNLSGAISYLEAGLVIAEQTAKREDEARLKHRLGMAMWQRAAGDEKTLAAAQAHLERAASLFESIRREAAKGAPDYKLRLFDLQTECYQVLQRLLVLLGRHGEALVVAERARTRAFVDLLQERSSAAARRKLDDSIPTTVAEVVSLVNRQKASVLYYSIAVGYLHVWLVVPTKGIVKFHQVRVSDESEAGNSVLQFYRIILAYCNEC